MQWKFAILALALTVLACSLGVPSQTVPEIVPSPTLEFSPATETPTPIIITAQPTPLPTGTSTPIPLPTNNLLADENRIKFASGGPWAEVGTHLEGNQEIRYVLSAMEGQIMSISVRQSWPFIVEVTSPSSDPLIDPSVEYPFWRGILPTTGDYTILVKTHATGDFTLRVAVNPPEEPYQYFDYSDPQHLYTLHYTDEFAPFENVPAGDFKGNPELVLGLIRPDFLSPVTNLVEAYFLFSVMDDAQTVNTCTQPLSPLETITGQKTINGYDFTQSEAFGVAAGNNYDQVIYRTVYNNICYEAVFYMHSGNIGNYTPGAVIEFDRNELVQKFEGILATFTVP
jgi:hypothetical protein